MPAFVRKICTPVRTRYCLVKKKHKACFSNLNDLVHYWGPTVDMYDPKELSEYSKLCFELYEENNN